MNENRKILVIDDERGIIDMLYYAFENEGYTVLTAQNGREGIEKVIANEIDVVITDIKMPEMDGMTVLGKIKEIKPAIEVIILTGFGTIETAIESLRKGAYDYVRKPVNLNDILKIVSKAYDTKQLKSQLVTLKELDKLKDEFLAMISHDLKTPVMAISNTVDMIQDAGDENKELLKVIARNAKKIWVLVTDLLDYAKMDVGSWNLKKEKIPAAKIVADTINEIKSLADKKNIKITGVINQSVTAENILISCDLGQIKRVLTNLLSNSIKYTPNAGEISVYFEKNDTEVEFIVEDNGIGIAKENINKLFDKFYRIDSDLEEESGLGLGLSICKKIVELHNGKILAESEGLGKGCKFTFTIPIGN